MIIDCNYLIKVEEYLPMVLPKPTLKKKVLVCDGEVLPIVHIECED